MHIYMFHMRMHAACQPNSQQQSCMFIGQLAISVSLQELASLREQLLAAEVTTAGAVKEAAHLRQQLRSLQRTQSQVTPPTQAELSSQVMPVIDLLMKDTYTALRDEFQSDVTYKVSISCVIMQGSSLSLIYTVGGSFTGCLYLSRTICSLMQSAKALLKLVAASQQPDIPSALQGTEIEHVLKSTMRKQVLAGQQAVLDLASQS